MSTGQLLEHLLDERLGATGRGINEKLTSVETDIPHLITKIRYIGAVRNSFAHDVNPTIRDPEKFVRTAREVLNDLNARPEHEGAARADAQPVIDTSALYAKQDVPTPEDVKLISGIVGSFRTAGDTIQLTLTGVALAIDLSVQQKCAIGVGDQISLAGFRLRSDGSFKAFAYRNQSRDVCGWNSLPDDTAVDQKRMETEAFEKPFVTRRLKKTTWALFLLTGFLFLNAITSLFQGSSSGFLGGLIFTVVSSFFSFIAYKVGKPMREPQQYDWEGLKRSHNNWRLIYGRCRNLCG